MKLAEQKLRFAKDVLESLREEDIPEQYEDVQEIIRDLWSEIERFAYKNG